MTQLFEQKDSIKLACLFLLYFIQAMPYGFQSRYLPLVMRQSGISLTSLGLYKLLLVPWICKFFISAFVVDVYKTKRFWLLTSMLILVIGSFVGMIFNDFNQLAFILFILNWASACQDICVDWFAINALKEEDLGLGNTVQVAAFKIGTLFSGGVLVFFMDYTTISWNFFILGLIYLICYLLLNSVSFNEKQGIDENCNSENNISFKERFLMLHKSPATYWICVFVLIYKLGEQSALNMLPMFLVDQKVSSTKIGFWTGIIGQSFSISGSILAGILLKKTNKKVGTQTWMKYTVFIRIIPIFLMTYLIHMHENSKDYTQSIDSSTLNGLIGIAMVQLFFSGFLTTFTFTLMMEISFKAPKHIQATHFSLLATCEVLGKLLMQPLISAYTDYFGYSSGFFLFSVLYVVALITFQFRPVKILTKTLKSTD